MKNLGLYKVLMGVVVLLAISEVMLWTSTLNVTLPLSNYFVGVVTQRYQFVVEEDIHRFKLGNGCVFDSRKDYQVGDVVTILRKDCI